MKLYTYFRSSAAYRVRIALGLKGLAYAAVPVHLVRGGPDGGPENRGPAYRAVNPQARVPALTLDDGTTLIQSAAIFEWLEETHPTPALLPSDPIARARVRAIVGIVNDIQPLQNTFALNALKSRFGADAAALAGWASGFIADGLATIEALLPADGPFAFGAAPTFADCAIVPQLVGARRFGVDLGPFPRIRGVEAAMLALPAVQAARPEAQPDAE